MFKTAPLDGARKLLDCQLRELMVTRVENPKVAAAPLPPPSVMSGVLPKASAVSACRRPALTTISDAMTRPPSATVSVFPAAPPAPTVRDSLLVQSEPVPVTSTLLFEELASLPM